MEENKKEVFLDQNKQLDGKTIHAVIPCLHGFPGETGHIQAQLDLFKLPYFGPNMEGSNLAFNKVTTKLWLQAMGIPTAPFVFLNKLADINKAEFFWEEYEDVFVKASSQGSSVGCYHVTKKEELLPSIKEALKFSPFVLIEKTVKGRELEVSVYEWQGTIKSSQPGEVVCPSGFYTYEEKYSKTSHTHTSVKAQGLSDEHIFLMKTYAEDCFQGLGLRHLSRIDFFLSKEGQIYLNEVNTFPGLTPISMFPQMMEAEGDSFRLFLNQTLQQICI